MINNILKFVFLLLIIVIALLVANVVLFSSNGETLKVIRGGVPPIALSPPIQPLPIVVSSLQQDSLLTKIHENNDTEITIKELDISNKYGGDGDELPIKGTPIDIENTIEIMEKLQQIFSNPLVVIKKDDTYKILNNRKTYIDLDLEYDNTSKLGLIHVNLLQKVDTFSGSLGLAKLYEIAIQLSYDKIELEDQSTIILMKYLYDKLYCVIIRLSTLFILSYGESWYNKNKYYSDQYALEKEINVRAIQLSIINFISELTASQNFISELIASQNFIAVGIIKIFDWHDVFTKLCEKIDSMTDDMNTFKFDIPSIANYSNDTNGLKQLIEYLFNQLIFYINFITNSETPQIEPPQIETPQIETTQIETPQIETTQIKTPQIETPQSETPQIETPQSETPQSEPPQSETPQSEPYIQNRITNQITVQELFTIILDIIKKNKSNELYFFLLLKYLELLLNIIHVYMEYNITKTFLFYDSNLTKTIEYQ